MIIEYDQTLGGQTVFTGLAGVRECFTGLFARSVDSVIIVHDQTSGGQTVFTGLAGVRDCFTDLFARLSIASGLTELAAFGGQDVNSVLLDDTEDSVIIVYD